MRRIEFGTLMFDEGGRKRKPLCSRLTHARDCAALSYPPLAFTNPLLRSSVPSCFDIPFTPHFNILLTPANSPTSPFPAPFRIGPHPLLGPNLNVVCVVLVVFFYITQLYCALPLDVKNEKIHYFI